ncbi:hypothetical protein B1218_38310, partial [Pseudomonas ogarae]
DNTPISYWGAAAVQWVKPKAEITATGAISTHTTPQGDLFNVRIMSTPFYLRNRPSGSLCVLAGASTMTRITRSSTGGVAA